MANVDYVFQDFQKLIAYDLKEVMFLNSSNKTFTYIL